MRKLSLGKVIHNQASKWQRWGGGAGSPADAFAAWIPVPQLALVKQFLKCKRWDDRRLLEEAMWNQSVNSFRITSQHQELACDTCSKSNRSEAQFYPPLLCHPSTKPCLYKWTGGTCVTVLCVATFQLTTIQHNIFLHITRYWAPWGILSPSYFSSCTYHCYINKFTVESVNLYTKSRRDLKSPNKSSSNESKRSYNFTEKQ